MSNNLHLYGQLTKKRNKQLITRVKCRYVTDLITNSYRIVPNQLPDKIDQLIEQKKNLGLEIEKLVVQSCGILVAKHSFSKLDFLTQRIVAHQIQNKSPMAMSASLFSTTFNAYLIEQKFTYLKINNNRKKKNNGFGNQNLGIKIFQSRPTISRLLIV